MTKPIISKLQVRSGHRAIVLAAILAILGSFAACNDGNSNNDPASAIRMEFKVDLPSSDGGKKAEFAVTWRGQIAQANGTGGTDTPFEVTKNYSSFYNSSGDYTAIHYIQSRRPGTWDLSVTGNGWPAQCQVNLQEGKTTVVTFTYQQSGCSSHVQ